MAFFESEVIGYAILTDQWSKIQAGYVYYVFFEDFDISSVFDKNDFKFVNYGGIPIVTYFGDDTDKIVEKLDNLKIPHACLKETKLPKWRVSGMKQIVINKAETVEFSKSKPETNEMYLYVNYLSFIMENPVPVYLGSLRGMMLVKLGVCAGMDNPIIIKRPKNISIDAFMSRAKANNYMWAVFNSMLNKKCSRYQLHDFVSQIKKKWLIFGLCLALALFAFICVILTVKY